MLVEDCIQSSLIYYPRILQSEGHHSIAIHPKWCLEGCMLLIVWIHLNLIVFRESIHERNLFKPTRVVDHNIYDWKGKLILKTSFI